jgi:hypothetical protein
LIDRWVQLELASIRRSAEPRNAVRFVGGSHPPVIFDPCNIKPLDMLGKSRTDPPPGEVGVDVARADVEAVEGSTNGDTMEPR